MRLFEKTPEAMTGSRIAAVDYAKTLAIVCVVMIHGMLFTAQNFSLS